MLANESEFEVLLARYDDDPAICSKILRTHALTDPKIFLAYAQKAILGRPVSRALRFIAGVAIGAGMMDALLELYGRSRTQCMLLAQKLMVCDPRFDIALLEYLQRPRPGNAGEENLFHVGLDILDLISQGDRLVPGVLKILKHPNPKVRSKAALFIGSRTQNLAWAASRTQEYDARVRANIIESLFGINSDFVHQIFRNNVADENNRVAGNAILGLYLLGDTASIPLIHDLARHPDARFRNTSAWIMGRAGDPRFAQSFSELMNDPDELVRAQAFKGLGELRKVLRAGSNRPDLRSAIVKLNAGDHPSLIATVHDGLGNAIHGIPPTSFILKTGAPSRPVRSFTVDEYDCRSPLNVAFILCLPVEDAEAAEVRFAQALQACECLRRSKDRWAILKIGAKTHSKPRSAASSDSASRYRSRWSILHVDFDGGGQANASGFDAQGLEYSSLPQRVEAMLREGPVALGTGADDEASKLVVNSLLRVDIASGSPHLIFFGGGPEPHLIEPLRAKGADLPANIHVLAQTGEWQAPEVRELALRTGGVFRQVAPGAGIVEVCFETYSSLMHHYRIGWSDAPPENLELDLYCEAGKSAAAYHSLAPQTVPNSLIA